MFNKYYNKLRFSQKMADRSLVICMKIIENHRNYVLSTIKEKKVLCHQGCNHCCHSFTLTVDTLSSYILLKVFETIPFNELFPLYKSCVENRIKSQDYIDSLPDNLNYYQESYNKLGFTVSSCPFVDKEKGCLIHNFNPQICYTYFSSIPCKFIINPTLEDNDRMQINKLKNITGNVLFSGLDNDNNNFNFKDSIIETYAKLDDYSKIIKNDMELLNFINHSVRFEILTIVALSLEKSNPETFKDFMKGLEVDLIGYIDENIKYF